jgi:hypothetical protein
MTDRPRPASRRLSRRALRAWAWIAGLATFASPAAALAMQPKPSVAAAEAARTRRPVIVVRKVTRRVIVREPAASGGIRYVYTGGGSGGSSSGSSSAASAPVPAPAPTSTGGS